MPKCVIVSILPEYLGVTVFGLTTPHGARRIACAMLRICERAAILGRTARICDAMALSGVERCVRLHRWGERSDAYVSRGGIVRRYVATFRGEY